MQKLPFGSRLARMHVRWSLPLILLLAPGLWAQNLRIGSAVNDCAAFVEVPILWVQPDTSNVTTMAFEFTYNNSAFLEQYIAPNDPSNRPLVIRGAALQAGVGTSFQFISQQ